MRLLNIVIGGLVLASVPGRASAGEPPLAQHANDAQARELFNAERYAEAGAEFERLWTEQSKSIPKYLFNAAVARELAGHELHAFILLRQYLALSGTTEPERATAQERIEALTKRTFRLRVLVSPATLTAATLSMEVERGTSDVGRSPLRLDSDLLRQLAVPGYPGAYDLYIETGPWTVTLAAPGYRSSSAQMTVVAPEQIVIKMDSDVALAPKNVPHPGTGPKPITSPKPDGRPTVIVLGSLAGAGIIVGATITTVFAGKFNQSLDTYYSETPLDGELNPHPLGRDLLMNPVTGEWRSFRHGPRIMGVGLGLGMGALTKAFEHRLRHPTRLWIAELISGGGLAAVGFGLWLLPHGSFIDTMQMRYCTSPQTNQNSFCTTGAGSSLAGSTQGTTVNSLGVAGFTDFVGGLGIGLAASGLVGLAQIAWRKQKRRDSVTRLSVTGGTGITVSF